MEAIFTALASNGTAPPEYLEFKLCEKFGWTPEELNRQPVDQIEIFLYTMLKEKEFKNLEEKIWRAET